MQLTSTMRCPNCHNTSLSSNARLRPNKAGCDFVLGCDECSIAVDVLDALEALEILNNIIVQMTDKAEMSRIIAVVKSR